MGSIEAVSGVNSRPASLGLEVEGENTQAEVFLEHRSLGLGASREPPGGCGSMVREPRMGPASWVLTEPGIRPLSPGSRRRRCSPRTLARSTEEREALRRVDALIRRRDQAS